MADDLKPIAFVNRLDPIRSFLSIIPFLTLLITAVFLASIPQIDGSINPFYQDLVAASSLVIAGALISLVIRIGFLRRTPKIISIGAEGFTLDNGRRGLSFLRYEGVVSSQIYPNVWPFKQEGGMGRITQANADGTETTLFVSGRIAQAIEYRRTIFFKNRSDGILSNPVSGQGIKVVQEEVPYVKSIPVTISKGKATYGSRITFIGLPLIAPLVLLYALRSGALWGTFAVVMFAFLSIQVLRKLRALSGPILVRSEGLALYDAPSLVFFSVGSPKPIPISRREISLIRVSDTLERKAFRRKVIKGRSDMVLSTKAGKDYFLMKRPTDELLRAARILGFPQEGHVQSNDEAFVPRTYSNTVDIVTEQRAYPIISVFIFLVISFMSWGIHFLGSWWILAVLASSIFLLLPAMLYVMLRLVGRSSARNPSQVSVGRAGMTLVFKNGKTIYVDFFDLEAVFPIFRSSINDDGHRLKRGLFHINGKQIISVKPEIVMAIREAYRTSRGFYPSVSPY